MAEWEHYPVFVQHFVASRGSWLLAGIPTVLELLEFVAANSSHKITVTDAMKAEATKMEV